MSSRRAGVLPAVFLLPLVIAACRQDMYDQPRGKPLGESDFFADGASARAPVAGTVARGDLRADRAFHTGLGADGKFIPALPVPFTAGLLARGRERFDVFCSPCHGRVGDGRGMIVQRGLKPPASYHVDRLRAQPPGYFFDVITNGFGQMSGYASQVEADDRWAIAAYIRALQLSQHAPLSVLPEQDRKALDRTVGDERRMTGGQEEAR